MSRADEDRRNRLEVRAVRAMVQGKLEEAERMYRQMGSSLGLAIVAIHAGAWERAATKALRFLDFWDAFEPATPDERKKGEDDATIALQALAIALDRIEDVEPRNDTERKRRDRITAKGRARLAAVKDWTKIRRHIRKIAREAAPIFGPLASERLGRNLRREGLAAAADLVLEGLIHEASFGIKGMGSGGAFDPTAETFEICPHCLEELTETSIEDARKILPTLRDYVRVFVQGKGPEPKDREHAILHGTVAVYFAGILARVGDPVDDLLANADASLRAALRLAPSGMMKEGTEPLLAAFVAFHRARISELRGRPEEALPVLDSLVSEAVEPWAERAAAAAARIRTVREAAERRLRTAALRAQTDAARGAGDEVAERAALADLLAISDEDALVERLAVLEVSAHAAGAVERATEAVRRGSDEPVLLAALVEEATRQAAADPRRAIPLFRLALHGGPLDSNALASFAAALEEAGRWAEAGKAYNELGAAAPKRFLDAARAFAKGGEVRKALDAVRALLDAGVSVSKDREAYAFAATLAPPDALRPLAEIVVARDAGNRQAAGLLARLKARDYRARAEVADRARSEGLAAFGKGDWKTAAARLAAIPEAFRDEDARRALARALEGTGDLEGARDLFASLRPSREVLEGRARCEARLKRFAEARGIVRALLDGADNDVAFAFGDDPDLLGMHAEASGDLHEAAGRFEDEGCLRSLAERARNEGDAIAEYVALSRLADRLPSRSSEVQARLAVLDGLVPVRAKGRHAAGMPTLVLCDTNVLLADLLEGASVPTSLDGLRRPSAAIGMRELRASAGVRLAVTKTVARELRAVLRYQSAVQEDEESAEAVRGLLARAEDVVASLDVSRVAKVVPDAGPGDLERVRAFYRQFRGRLGRITERKARRAPERAAAIRSRRTRGKAAATPLPEAADLRLLAEAAGLAEVPITGIGGVGLLSDDADFREFRAEIERAFGVRVY